MQRFILAFFISILLLAPLRAGAFDTPLQDAAQRALLEKMAQAHQKIAQDLCCGDFAWGNIAVTKNTSTYTLKYLPTGADMASWKLMTAITVYPLSGDKAADAAFMAATIAMLRGQYKKYAGIISDVKYETAGGEPMLFFEYLMGKGDQAVYSAAAFMRTGADTAAFIQLQSRGEPVPTPSSLKVKEMVYMEAK